MKRCKCRKINLYYTSMFHCSHFIFKIDSNEAEKLGKFLVNCVSFSALWVTAYKSLNSICRLLMGFEVTHFQSSKRNSSKNQHLLYQKSNVFFPCFQILFQLKRAFSLGLEGRSWSYFDQVEVKVQLLCSLPSVGITK